MNTARQILHILGKDIRGHRSDIGVVLLLNLLVAIVMTRPWSERLDFGESTTGGTMSVLLVVAWCLLIGRVVQSDAPSGRNPYWLTRPCSRGALLAAKLAFVLLFVHVPTWLAQLAIVTGSGVPLSVSQLLLNQLVFVAGVSLPIAAIASLTTSLSRFVLVAVIGVPIAVLVIGQASELRGYPVPTGTRINGGLSTFEEATELALVALIAGVALVCQYRRRSTMRIAVSSLAALALLAAGMLLATPPLIQRARAVAVGLPTVAPTLRLREGVEWAGNSLQRPFPGSIAAILLPLELPVTDEVEFRYVEGRLRMADGRTLETHRGRIFGPPEALWLDLTMPLSWYDSVKDVPASLHLVVEYETFQAIDTGPIPLDGSYVVVAGRAQCGVGQVPAILCRTSFGSTRLYLHEPRREVIPIQSKPQPLRFVINPVETLRNVNALPSGAPPFAPTTTSLRERLSYTRQEVTFDDIRLADWGPEQD